MIGLIAAALATTLSCQMTRQVVVNASPATGWGVGNYAIAANELSNWQFQVTKINEAKFRVVTKTDVMNIAGEWTVVKLAPGQYGFATVAAPCTFTEETCTALVEVSESGPDAAFVAVTVAGSAKAAGRELRDHLQLMILGTCVVPGAKAKP